MRLVIPESKFGVARVIFLAVLLALVAVNLALTVHILNWRSWMWLVLLSGWPWNFLIDGTRVVAPFGILPLDWVWGGFVMSAAVALNAALLYLAAAFLLGRIGTTHRRPPVRDDAQRVET
jgi:hypothetical protein